MHQFTKILFFYFCCLHFCITSVYSQQLLPNELKAIESVSSSTIIIQDIELRTQSDVDSLLINYSSIDTIFGNLDIYGFNDENEDVITDLSPLSNLKYLNGALTLHQLQSDLIESLSLVNFHELLISNKNIPLILPPFENVDSLFRLLIVETDSIIGDIIFPNLQKYCSNIEMRQNGYSEGSLKLPKLKSLGRIEFYFSSMEFVEIDNLEELYYVDFESCKGFKGFKNCENLNLIIDMKISGSDSLVSVFDSTGNIQINRAVISKNINLIELLGLESIEYINDLEVFDNESLEKISLPTLRTSGSPFPFTGLNISNNPNLEILDFPSLELSSILLIENSNSLQTLAGFPLLTELTTLTINENHNLENLDSLHQSLNVLNQINLLGNTIMNVCNSPIICNHLSAQKPFDAYGNSSDCEREIDMILSCGLQPNMCPEGDVLISDDTDIEYFELYYNTCKEILGDLKISGELITNDIKFDSLISIKGELLISNLLQPIKIDFEQLEFLDSYLTISNNNSNFELSSDKPVLGNGYYTRLINNENLISLSNFDLISDGETNVEVLNNLNLLDLDILSGFSNFERLRIENNKSLKDLSDLNSDGLISNITATDNDSLSICDVPIICENLISEYLTSLTLYNNADSCSTDQVMNSCLGIVAVSDVDQLSVQVFPNPTNSLVNVDYQGKINMLEVYDLSGSLIFRKYGVKQIDLSGQRKGTFLLRVKTDEGDKSFRIFKLLD